MVEGLLAAAEMVDFVADRKLRESVTLIGLGQVTRATELRIQVNALRDLALAFRKRASEEDTGLYVPIDGDPGPGWRKMSRRITVEVTPMTRWWRKIWRWKWPPWA